VKLEVHQRLAELSKATDKEYGKLVQKLLALALLEAGAEDLTDRCVQGIDLEATFKGKRRAIEVKTTESGSISLGKKDLEGLAAKEGAGSRAYVAALGNRFLDDWTFARFHKGELQPSQSYSITQLRPYREAELERAVSRAFADAVLAHADAAMRGGQNALDELLKAHAQYRQA
jgi:Holliday junction resolvase